MISNRQFGAVNSYADRRFIPIRSIIVLARYVYASAWECQFSRRRFFWERLGTPGLSPACFFPGRPYPLTGLPLCSPSPLCEPLFLIFGTNTWVSRGRKEKKRLRRDNRICYRGVSGFSIPRSTLGKPGNATLSVAWVHCSLHALSALRTNPVFGESIGNAGL